MIDKMNNFSTKELINPPAYFWPGYFWVINDKIDEKKMLRQLRDMVDHGAKSVCLLPEPPEFRPETLATQMDRDYLTKPYFELIQRLVAECHRLGMNYWFYDEGGWPSGGACGRVCAQKPGKFTAKVVVSSEQGPTTKETSYGCVPYPNLLNKEATKTFIKLTHEGHKPYLKKYFGNTIRFTFTDEPLAFPTQPGHLTWTDDMEQVFRKRKGYELRPLLPDLLKEPSDTERRKITQARVDFYDVWSQLLVERYLLPIRKWCRKNGLLSAGHFGGEDEPGNNSVHGYGHILRALRGLDVPGIDVIWRQLFPEVRSHQFPKYASSVARQMGQPLVLTESFAVFGNGLTPAQAKWVTDQQYVRGATLMVMGCFPYSTRDHFMGGERTHFGPNDPFWKYYDIYHAYTARLGYLLTRGQAVCSTAVYFDIRSIWAGASAREKAIEAHDRIADKLLKAQCDFDYIDDDALVKGSISAGRLKVGAMRYDTIVVPPTKWMDPKAKENLVRFEKAGGRILTMDQIPANVAPVVRISPKCEDIRVCKRAWNGGTLYFLTNEADRTVPLTLTFAEKGQPVLCDPETGELLAMPERQTEQGTLVEITIAPWGSAMVLFGVKAEGVFRRFVPGAKKIVIKEGWTLQPVCQHRVGEHDFEVVKLSDAKSVQAELGNWVKYLGRDFSGDVKYTIEFENSFDGPARLDLGKVNYACRVILNGKPVGRRIWRPFSFDVTRTLRKGHNTLQIIVTNSLANAIVDPQIHKSWKSRFGNKLGYDHMARKFEKESVPSGLFGPVRIVFGQEM